MNNNIKNDHFNNSLNFFSESTKKTLNPKTSAPAIYLPAWLCQVPSSKLPNSCKLVYGRLAQWATSNGIAYRSAAQLSKEIGISQRTVEMAIQRLKKNNLIGTYIKQDGMQNTFEFYDHEWMHAPIDKNLTYLHDSFSPPAKIADPCIDSDHTTAKIAVPSAKISDPTAKIAEHINNINNINKNTCGSDAPQAAQPLKKTQKEKIEDTAFENATAKELFEEKFKNHDIAYERLFENCVSHYGSKNQWVNTSKWISWIGREKPENYKTKSDASEAKTKRLSQDQFFKAQERLHFEKIRALSDEQFQRMKQHQYKIDAHNFNGIKNIISAVDTKTPAKKLSEMLKQYKDVSRYHDNRAMQTFVI